MIDSRAKQYCPAWDRKSHLQALGEKIYDLMVIGGGATGTAVARDAALRGLSVCLLERSDLASGSSSRSTRFIHGGLRYLKTLEFGFVREGLQERAIFLEVAPHLTRAVPFLFPSYRDHGERRWLLRFGVLLYDALAGKRKLSASRSLSLLETLDLEPGLRAEGLTGSVMYTDAIVDDARLVVEMSVAAVEAGAHIGLHVDVERIVPSDSGPAVALLKDRLTGSTLGARSAVVIIATGVWPGAALHGIGAGDKAASRSTPLRPSRGSHLVVPRATLPISSVIVVPSRRDGRILFAVPAGDFTYVGTTEIVHTGSLDEVRAEKEEVDYMREVMGEVFTTGPLPRDQTLSTWSGLRPLIERKGHSTGSLSRDYRITEEAPGVVAVTGGKLTSCRRMAEAVVDRAALILARRSGKKADPCITRWKLFPGAEGTIPYGTGEIPSDLDAQVARHLVTVYGARSEGIVRRIRRDPASGVPFCRGCPASPAEVEHAVDSEGAVRLADLLFRRFHPLFIEARLATESGRVLAEKASKVMGSLLGWNAEQRTKEIDDTFAEWKRDFSVPGLS